MEGNSLEKNKCVIWGKIIASIILPIIGAFMLYTEVFVSCCDKKTDEMKKAAITTFNNTDNDTIKLKVPLEMLLKAYKRDRNDNTYYDLVVNRADNILEEADFEYDRTAEKLFEEALKLSKTPVKAKNRLKELEKMRELKLKYTN